MIEQIIVSSIAILWLAACAILDWKHGEVSNWLTVPGMLAGFAYALMTGGERLVVLAAAFVGLIILYFLGSLGGADVKVLTALAGLWPTAMLAALLVQGIWGIIVLIRSGHGTRFRAIPAYALGAAISVLFIL